MTEAQLPSGHCSLSTVVKALIVMLEQHLQRCLTGQHLRLEQEPTTQQVAVAALATQEAQQQWLLSHNSPISQQELPLGLLVQLGASPSLALVRLKEPQAAALEEERDTVVAAAVAVNLRRPSRMLEALVAQMARAEAAVLQVGSR